MNTPLERVTDRVYRNGDINDPNTPSALLTLEEFFEGNDVVGSIGCNLFPAVEPAVFYQAFLDIVHRGDVSDVRVEVSMFDDPLWPFSERVWVMTSASPEEVLSWLPEELAPDDVFAGWEQFQPLEQIEVQQGMAPVGIWWD